MKFLTCPKLPAALAVSLLICLGSLSAEEAHYDPLALPTEEVPSTLDLSVQDAARARDIPVFFYLPKSTAPAPVIIFSHGLGGTRKDYSYLGPHWAGRGYVVLFLQHHGSDDAVWRDAPPAERLSAMREAASVQNFLLRVKDVPAVIDQLERWNTEKGHPLAARLDLAHIGMSGHSFGAVTTQGVSGESFPMSGTKLTDARITAALAMSPSSPRGETNAEAFGGVRIPWLVMTGTKDVVAIGGETVESRQAVFEALPPGNKYELILDGGQHSAFTDRPLPGDNAPRNPNHHRAILGLSTAFWDAELRNDLAAKAWLNGDSARSVLEPGDRWEKK